MTLKSLDDLTPHQKEELSSLAKEFDLDPIETRYMGPLLAYMTADRLQDVKEIVLNKPQRIGFEHLDGTWTFEDAPLLTVAQLEDAARVMANRAGQIFGKHNPILSLKMPQGHRIQIVAGHNCVTEFSITIRIQRKKTFGIKDFGFSDEDEKQIIELVKGKKTILISGGTGSGKTTFMNACLQYIPDDERIITMEDVPELEINRENAVPLLFTNEAGDFDENKVQELLNAALRMRPDRILLGEIRKENAFAFCSAINTGHDGSMATIHASRPDQALDAVMNRVMMNGDIAESALSVLRRQLEGDIYAIVQLNRVGAGVKGYIKVLRNGDDA